ncbi:MAG TPA: hypothetical protein VIE65_02835 [Methylobacter sp.]|jgi:hypothetical protein
MVGLFEQRAVAFLDVLGFKQLVNEAEKTQAGFDKLAGLDAVISNHVRWDNNRLKPEVPKEAHPKYIFISDSIIISTPLLVSIEGVDGLDILAVKCTQVAQKLLEMGLIVRGGISVGSVWHSGTNIFGSAYVEAYQIEQQARHPRIMLSKKASELWRKPARFAHDICIPDGDSYIVDILHAAYLRTNAAGIPMESSFAQFRAYITSNIELLPQGEARSKWIWFAKFFNEALRRHGLSTQAITLPANRCPHQKWPFVEKLCFYLRKNPIP